MSENVETQNVENVENQEKVESNPVETVEKTEEAEQKQDENIQMEKLASLVKEIASKRDELKQDLIERREYLNKIVPQYDSENYFKNESFKNLYSELFNHIGTKLDMEKFVPLLDKYVEARIEAKTRESLAKKENDKATDGIFFEKGESKKAEKKLKMQDIPLEELESYIAKYV